MATTRVLVPVRVVEGQALSQGVVELLAPAEVVLLGYHVIPEQTAPGQARMTFEERAQAQLDDVTEALAEAGASVETRLAFTHDREQTIDRVADEHDCDAVLYLNPAMEMERLLVTLHGDVNAERIGAAVAPLVVQRAIEPTLLAVTAPGGENDLLERARSALVGGGVDPTRIEERRVETETPVRAIADAAAEYDAVVLGERAPSLGELLFGDFEERVAAESLGPVLVVLGAPGTDSDGEGE
jgi:nucleotide-binding universal stress UspA family protein